MEKKKIYIVMTSSSDWEDYEGATFDKERAEKEALASGARVQEVEMYEDDPNLSAA